MACLLIGASGLHLCKADSCLVCTVLSLIRTTILPRLTSQQYIPYLISLRALSLRVSNCDNFPAPVRQLSMPGSVIHGPTNSIGLPPDQFHGDPKELEAFFSQLEIQFHLNKEGFPTVIDQTLYAFSFCRRAASDWTTPLKEDFHNHKNNQWKPETRYPQRACSRENPMLPESERLCCILLNSLPIVRHQNLVE